MAYINGKKIFLAGLNINKIQDIPGTVTTWADLFGLSDGVYNVPKRTTNIIYFPTSIFSTQTELVGLIEITNSRLIAYGVHKEITREGTKPAYTYSAINFSGKGLSTNDFTDIEKVFLEETLPQEIERIDAKITEVEGNVYSNFKNKVDKENGKGLSANDFTTELKDKLDGVEEGANKTAVDAELSATSENPVQNKAVKAALDEKVDEPTGNGLVRKYMSGIYGTMGVDMAFPETPSDNNVPTTKLVADQLKNPLKLDDENLQKSGLILQNYISPNSTSETTGTTRYMIVPRDGSILDDTIKGLAKTPSSYAVGKYVKEKIAATTPSINESGNWVIGTTDTGVSAKGIKGDTGPQGAQGLQGAKGADGKTPVKGTDYFTEADKQELVNAVIAALPNGNGVAY